MYSEDDEEYVFIGDDDSSEVRTEPSVDLDAECDIAEDLIHRKYREYSAFFEEEDGTFRSTFPDLFIQEDDDVLPDLTKILTPLTTVCDSPQENEIKHVIEGKDVDVVVTTIGREDQFVEDEEAQKRNKDDVVDLKESPASRFMRLHMGTTVVFPLPSDVNRQMLQVEFGGNPALQFVPVDALYVGYVDKVAVGLGVALVEGHAAQQLLIVVPNTRVATEKDLRPFQKESSKYKKVIVSLLPVPPPLPSADSLQRRISKQRLVLMSSQEYLKKQIELNGGLQRTTFVCVDVEAAIVGEHCHAVPLEIAIVNVTELKPEEERSTAVEYHDFIHPGRMTDFVTVCNIAVGGLSGTSHGIPFRNCRMLRYDYSNLALELASVLSTPGLILVNKGPTLTDLQGIRWVFAAANVPEPPMIMFDVSAVVKLLVPEKDRCTKLLQRIQKRHVNKKPNDEDGELLDDMDSTFVEKPSCGSTPREAEDDAKRNNSYSEGGECRCWYHRKLVDGTQWAVHCALQDASALRDLMKDVLREPPN